MRFAPFKYLGLKSKLIITMTSLFIASSLTLFIISQNAQKRLLMEVEDNIDDLTKAIQVSVQNLTSDDEIEPGKLKEVLNKFKKRGINEISILSGKREIIASSDPKKIGLAAQKTPRESDVLIKAELGQKSLSENVKEFNIPIVIGNEKYGYINIIMHLDSLTRIQKRNFYIRLFSILFIFLSGTLISILVANKYTRPIQMIADATRRVSKEDLTPLTLDRNLSPELHDLAVNFNDMVYKLRERKDMESRIREMEHMFQVGQLSSAIAHEIKNPLNFMTLAVSQLQDETATIDHPGVTPLKPILKGLDDEIRKLNTLVTNFLEYGRPLKLKMEYMSLPALIDDLLKLVGTKLHDLDIAISVSGDRDVNIIGDREKLSGCFLNLILNALESIQQDGRIDIVILREKERVAVHFRDSGHGVPCMIRDKIFEPYFSSKTTGMGLGLSFTKKIVLEHGGNIWLNDTYAGGAEFIVTLPVNV